MARLSQYSRNSIRGRAVADFVAAELEKLRPEGEALGLLCYREVISLELEAQLRALPDGFLLESNKVKVLAQGWRVELPLGVTAPMPRETYDMVKLSNLGNETCPETLLCNAVMDWARRLKDIDARRDELKSQLGSMLAAFKNWRELMEGWPEGKPFWEPSLPSNEPIPGLPAVTVRAINEALGLPKP